MNWRKAATVILVAIACVVASAGTLAVTAAGFALSFDAIRAVGRAAYISPGITWMLPVAIDGAMAVAMVTAIVLRWLGRSPWYPWAVVLVGAAVSIGCNAAHASIRGGALELPTEAAMAVSAIPAATLALSVHMLIVLALAVVQGPVSGDETPAADPAAFELGAPLVPPDRAPIVAPIAAAPQPIVEPAPAEPDAPAAPPESDPEDGGESGGPDVPAIAGQHTREDARTADQVTATILALATANPDWKPATIAATAGRSETHVRRVLRRAGDAPVSAPPSISDSPSGRSPEMAVVQ